MVDQITDAMFNESVLQSDIPVLVDFWAPWCGPCRALSPVVEELAKDYEGRVRIVQMNVDVNAATPAKFGIRAIPTLILFKNGEVVTQHAGALPKENIRSMLDGVL